VPLSVVRGGLRRAFIPSMIGRSKIKLKDGGKSTWRSRSCSVRGDAQDLGDVLVDVDDDEGKRADPLRAALRARRRCGPAGGSRPTCELHVYDSIPFSTRTPRRSIRVARPSMNCPLGW
jgi:hypothetical protein